MHMSNNYNHVSTMIAIYNSAYRSYLDGIKPNIFLHTMLLNILRSLEGIHGVILEHDPETNCFKVMVRTSSTFSETDDEYFSSFVNTLMNNKMDKHSPIMKCVDYKEVLIESKAST